MDEINLNVAPYHDRFDAKENRNKVLFRPDRPLQQAELNELQSIAESNVRGLGDTVFLDGAMQTGMSFNIDEDEETIEVEDGIVYVSGKVRQFYKQEIEFHKEGTEKIGVKLERRIIDHNEDPTLLDQTQGVESHLSAGADRLEEVVVLTYNDESAPTIYEFDEGKLFLEPDRPEFSLINDVLAQRTREESGSYRVEGFELWVDEEDYEDVEDDEDDEESDGDTITLAIGEGKAYVRGYRIHKSTPSRVVIPKSQETREVVQETHTYDVSDRKFKVGSDSVQEVSQVIARVDSPAGGVTVAKGAVDGRDSINDKYTSINRDSIVLKAGRTYEYGDDYKIIEEDGIQYVDWDMGLNSNQPDSGESYTLTFEYDRVMKEKDDYRLETTKWENGKGWDTLINFGGTSGIKPKDGGIMRVNYQYYLSRTDLINLDQLGNFSIVEGQSDRAIDSKVPEQSDPHALKVGDIYLYPNSDVGDPSLNGTVRLQMKDLQRMKYRLADVEYNQAIQQLESEAIVSEDPLNLRGVFADAFTDLSRMDSHQSTVAFSLEDASITLKVDSPDDQKKHPELDIRQSTAQTWGRLVTAPFIEKAEIVQPLASEAMNVNPYAVYNKMGVMKLTPEADNWINESKITVHEEDEESARLNRWWGHQAEGDPMGDLSKRNQELVDNTALHGETAWGRDLNRTSTVEGTMISSSQRTREEAIEFMRNVEVEYEVSNLSPMSNNLKLTFDGKEVHTDPTGSTSAGTSTGTVRTNAKGEATGKFIIPSNVRTGTREVTLGNQDGEAITTFSAQGTNKVTEDVITKTRVTFSLYDPLAQAFVFPSARVVTSFDLHFASKSDVDNVIIQIRGISDGGYPNRTIYSERILEPSDIDISDDGSVATNVALDDPLMAEAGHNYCIVVITDSQDYTMWIGTLGEELINKPGETITSQPYVDGVLFSSSNAVTWTAHQKSNMKFTVYTAEFQEKAVMEFDEMDELDSDMMLLMSSFLTPDNTGCFWEVKIIPEVDVGRVSMDDVPWEPLLNYVEKETHVVIGLAKLRATFKSNRYTSPMLALDDLMFANFISATEGDYVSKNINTEEAPYNRLMLSYDAFIPAGTSVKPFYSTDRGESWEEFDEASEIKRQSAEFERYEFTKQVSSSANNNNLKFKIELRSETRFRRPRLRRLVSTFKDEYEG